MDPIDESDNVANTVPPATVTKDNRPGVIGKDEKGRMTVNAVDVDPLGRLGGGEYFGAGELIYVERPA